MRRSTFRLPGRLVLAGSLLISGRVEAQESIPADHARSPSFWQAAGGVAAVNGLTWFYNWHVQGWAWANVGTQSWMENLRRGFAWDDDVFGANQLAHPYHGSLYFNAARASGYNFWGSAPFVMAGSLTWELFTENVRPSLNDLINTTLGGMALGEVAYRMSGILTSSKDATFGRQVGAIVVSPIAQAQSLVHRGHGWKSRQAVPESSSAWLAIGQRRGTPASPPGMAANRAFVGLQVQYGSPFDDRFTGPYDAFEFSLHLSPEERVVLTHAAVSGVLTRRIITRSPRSQLLLGLYQHYDYDDLPMIKTGSQSVSGALLYRRSLGGRTQLDFRLHLEAVPLGTVSSDYGLVRRRDYDFGPGIGGRVMGAVRHDGRDLLRLDARTVWIHSLYATDADHVATTAKVSAVVPVMRMVSLGGDFGLTMRRSFYPDQPTVRYRVPQVRLYLLWSGS
jgi:hypothetical protein